MQVMDVAIPGGRLTFFPPRKSLYIFTQSQIMALQRRMLLQVVTGVGVGLAGCSSIEGTEGTPTETPTDSADLNPEAQDIHVTIHNHLSQAITVSVELSTERTVLVNDEVTVDPNGFGGLDTGIDETGQYDLTVKLDDRDKEISLEVTDYDLEMGSNIVFWIDEDQIRYGIED